MTVAATAAGAVISSNQAAAQQNAAEYQADAAKVAVGQERAAAQQAAALERRQARYLVSRGIAGAAASGGAVTDPTVINVLGDLAAEGEYNAARAIYEGEERARGLHTQGSLLRYDADQYGQASRNALIAGGIGTLGAGLEGATNYFQVKTLESALADAGTPGEEPKTLFSQYNGGSHGLAWAPD